MYSNRQQYHKQSSNIKKRSTKTTSYKRKCRKKRRNKFVGIILLLLLAGLTSRLPIVQNLISEFKTVSTVHLQEEGYPDSLITLYENNPEARQFVLDYKEYKDNNDPIDLSSDVEGGTIPLFIQWDERWGYNKYGDNFLAITGCGPTSLSMVYVGLTGDTSMNPYEIAKKAESEGYYMIGSGSSWNMMTELANELGLSASELGMDENAVRSHLQNNHPIICIMGPGDFTNTGHFIVLTGIAENDEIIVNDPNSRKNSNKTWKFSTFSSQIKDMWVYSK